MNFIKFSILGVVAFLCAVSTSYSNEISDLVKAAELLRFHDSRDWKPGELTPTDREQIQKAEKDLLEHQAILMRTVKNKEDGWISCAYGLARSRDPGVAALFIRLVRENFFMKEADGRRMEFGFGSKNGCELQTNQYGAVLAALLGVVGDARAIPVLKEAIEKGDPAVQQSAYCSLYRLEAITFEELVRILKTDTEPRGEITGAIMNIITEMSSRDPESAIGLYNLVIPELSEESFEFATAHYRKIRCYQDLKQYDRALEQCDVVSKIANFKNYTQQMPELRERIKEQAADHSASASEPRPETNKKSKPESEARSR